MKIPKGKVILGSLVTILLLLILTIPYRYNLINNQLIPLKSPSKAQFLMKGDRISLEFQTSSQDIPAAQEFLKNLGLEENVLEGISLDLDEPTAKAFKEYLPQNPLKLNLVVSSKAIEFDSQPDLSFFKKQEPPEYQDPSSEGRLKVENLGGNDYRIEIDEPSQVLSESTASGRLRLSEKLADPKLWQVLSKFARISIMAEKGRVSGTLTLK